MRKIAGIRKARCYKGVSDPVACKNTWNFTKLGMGEGPDLFQVPGKVVPDWHPILCFPCMSV